MKVFIQYYRVIMQYFSDGSSIPVFRTFIVIFFFAYLNILSVFSVLDVLTGKKISIFSNNEGINWFLPLFVIIPLFILFYNFLNKLNLNSELILTNKLEKMKLSPEFIAILYFVGSVLLFIASLWLRQYVKGH